MAPSSFLPVVAIFAALTLSTPVHASPGFTDLGWTNAMNQASYWDTHFGASCTKYENHDGNIAAKYDAAVTKKGSDVVRVYADLTQTGAFQATHPQGEPPMSWVMKCTKPTPPTTVPPTTAPPTTLPPETTVPPTTAPPEVTTTTALPEVTTTTAPWTTEPPLCEEGLTWNGSGCVPDPCVGICGPASVPSTVALPEVCLQHRTGGDPLDVWVEYDSLTHPGVTGSTRWGLMPCGPVQATTPPAATPPALPATGDHHLPLVLAALAALGSGAALTRIARRP